MKQPKVEIAVVDWRAHTTIELRFSHGHNFVFRSWPTLVKALRKPAALRLAIKRLDRLKRDCERELAKQEVGK